MPAIFGINDVLVLKEALWPHVTFYDRQVEIIDSVCRNDETYVPAGNKLGKDFVAAFIALSSFVICQAKDRTCRILTTSVAQHHLDVLWGEIGGFLSSSRVPLLSQQGGPLAVNSQEVRRVEEMYAKNPLNYLVGKVSAKGEGMAGHHAEHTLIIGDEASGLDDDVYKAAQGWGKRMLWIGNTNPCTNFYRAGCDAGDLFAPSKLVA